MKLANLKLLALAVEAANAVVSKVSVSVPLADSDLADENLRKLTRMHTSLVQVYYETFCKAAGIWQAPPVSIEADTPTQPATPPGTPLSPLPNAIGTAK